MKQQELEEVILEIVRAVHTIEDEPIDPNDEGEVSWISGKEHMKEKISAILQKHPDIYNRAVDQIVKG
jgi:hypothetical protein